MGCNEGELFQQRSHDWMRCGMSVEAMPVGIQEGTAARQDHQALFKTGEKDTAYPSLRPDNRCNRTP